MAQYFQQALRLNTINMRSLLQNTIQFLVPIKITPLCDDAVIHNILQISQIIGTCAHCIFIG